MESQILPDMLGRYDRSVDSQRRLRIPFQFFHYFRTDAVYVQKSKYKRAAFVTVYPSVRISDFSEANFKLDLREGYDENNKDFVMANTYRCDVNTTLNAKSRITLPGEIFEDICFGLDKQKSMREFKPDVTLYGIGKAFYILPAGTRLQAGPADNKVS